jgi:hypothetical protein
MLKWPGSGSNPIRAIFIIDNVRFCPEMIKSEALVAKMATGEVEDVAPTPEFNSPNTAHTILTAGTP